MTASCPKGVLPEDAAAWAVDGEPVAGVDMARHVPTCPVCQAVVAQVLPAREFGRRHLGGEGERIAAARAGERAVRRVRAESTGLLLLRTLGGAFARVGRAVPDYLAGGDLTATPTGEPAAGDAGAGRETGPDAPGVPGAP